MPRYVAALREARRIIAAQRAIIVENHCLLDSRNRPILATLEEGAPTRDVRRMEQCIELIDDALAEGE